MGYKTKNRATFITKRKRKFLFDLEKNESKKLKKITKVDKPELSVLSEQAQSKQCN